MMWVEWETGEVGGSKVGRAVKSWSKTLQVIWNEGGSQLSQIKWTEELEGKARQSGEGWTKEKSLIHKK